MLLLHLERQLQFFPLHVTSINTQKYKERQQQQQQKKSEQLQNRLQLKM